MKGSLLLKFFCWKAEGHRSNCVGIYHRMICVEGWVLTEFVLFLSTWIYFEVHRSNCIGIYRRMICVEGWVLTGFCAFSVDVDIF